MTAEVQELVASFGQQLSDLGWISDLQVGGSLATGDHRAGVSDLDLVAVTPRPLTDPQLAHLRSIHAAISPAAKLGCTYVPAQLIAAPDHKHPTWTHGRLIRRRLSSLARAELVQHGHAVFGREPGDVWASMTSDDVRQAVVQEMAGYWTWASRRPWLWLSTDQIDLTVTTMLRAGHTLATGELITKTAALSQPFTGAVPTRLLQDVRARRDGAGRSTGARLPLHAVASWRLARQTISASRVSARLTSRG